MTNQNSARSFDSTFGVGLLIVVVIASSTIRPSTAASSPPQDDRDPASLERLASIAAMECVSDGPCRAKYAVVGRDVGALARDIEATWRSHGFSDEFAETMLRARPSARPEFAIEKGGGGDRIDPDERRFLDLVLTLATTVRLACVDPAELVEARATSYNVGVAAVAMIVVIVAFVSLFVASAQRSSLSGDRIRR